MKRDSVYLDHILKEMDFLQGCMSQYAFADITRDEVLKRSVIRSLEVIGEAAKNVSPECRRRYPGIPWKGMAGLRDRLIHAYFSINWELVSDVILIEIPAIHFQIRELHADELKREKGL